MSQIIQLQTSKSIEQLRSSDYHLQLARKMCAAFIAQQQGIALSTAFKKVEDPIGDLWLVLAELARQECLGTAVAQVNSARQNIAKLPVM